MSSDNLPVYDAISIRIAAPEVIRSWSRGEVKKPETINYRTFKPEKDGLFCEKIFGPTKDWECNCGKYKRVKHKGIVCDRCGVEVTLSRVRRERMGHIDLVAPAAHIWFFKSLPSRMGALCGLNVREMERVLYYEEYLVLDEGETNLRKGELLNEDKYQEALERFGPKFTAKMGAEAIEELLKDIDLDKLARKLHKDLANAKGETSQKKIFKILRIVENFAKSGNRPEWMILHTLPVIPPDLRPLVPLDGGRFATSDLNDLYRRVINRNNRLKKLMDLKAPEVIVRNEKRMLQEAVDALFDNGRHGRPVLGSGNRPLKSLSDMLKGKQGRFRQNLLGKRVDYSGRSVIVVGPELKLHQCGLPKQMALELFEPFIIKKLREKGFVHTIKSAKRMVENMKLEVWDILEDVIKNHPVLLNRAPTLHRLGIQAFEPVLIEGKAIRIHPLVCAAFNADFDGDQMAVHVPLCPEAQIESRTLMLSSNNIFSPANGRPIATPSQDIVLGCYYLTRDRKGLRGEGMRFSDPQQAIYAYEDQQTALHAQIEVRIGSEKIRTTVGRLIFNELLPDGMPFVNDALDKSKLNRVIASCYKKEGHHRTVELLDDLKELGFRHATKAGLSIAMSDLKIPDEKQVILAKAATDVSRIDEQYRRGVITDGERYNQVIDIWTRVTDDVADQVFRNLDSFNPVFMMADSGARGSKQQIRQLSGMRGLMAKPSGEIIENPIRANFREGLTMLEYFISTHGARKGLADTALKTADSGYLTRRLVDVAQDVIVTEEDCGTMNGIYAEAIVEGDEIVVSLAERIRGRVALTNVVNHITDEMIVEAGHEISEEAAQKIEEAGFEKIRVRSVLTCETEHGICSKCYGVNLASGRMAELGEAVGIIGAQSIGEPGTQLTMRTFHIGGTASRTVAQSSIVSKNSGILKYHNLKCAQLKPDLFIVLNRNGHISVHEEDGREIERQAIPHGSLLRIPDGGKITKGDLYVEWDPYTSSIISEVEGVVRYEDVVEDLTIRKEMDQTTGKQEKVVIDYKGDYHPQIIIYNERNEVLGFYPIPTHAHIVVNDGDHVKAGSVIAKTPRKQTKTKDITGGLPRVAELFEARKPKDPAIISEIEGLVEFGQTRKGVRRVIVRSKSGMKKEYNIPHGKHLNVYKGDTVAAGEQLVDGPVVLQDILKISGERKLQEYLVNEVQEVYRLQGVTINDKHIEVIVKQMLRKLRVEDPGDSEYLAGDQVDRVQLHQVNEELRRKNKKPAVAQPLIQGITKASLSTESWISAASFQETTRVLTEAATAGKVDSLRGLKENVIMGHLIPAGTGFEGKKREEIVKRVQDEVSSARTKLEEASAILDGEQRIETGEN
ncbi:MAG: DNA-directed RNA polymerase subunit beta' [Candidatus Omnitrophica bacterium]|nr:DNA-directed RNA polymerase subunit beta' [Candidatus Omnitrophota bacterium]